MSTTIFNGGIPYGPDLRRLSEAFPVESLTEGRVIGHNALASALGLTKGSPRYYAVIKTWKAARKRDSGIKMIWEPKVGLKVLDPSGVFEHTSTVVGRKTKQLHGALRGYRDVDRKRLPEKEQKLFDHKTIHAAKLQFALDQAEKELVPAVTVIKSLPRRATAQIA